MVWIASGPLVAGTSPETLPRVADAEMPGEQVVLKGFYIDAFPYPNEEGAIPLTNVSKADAAELCAQHDKRLCSELEWERACKGPDNFRYEYGDTYRPDRCATGAVSALRPSGLKVACRSGFGVRDMHGGVWEWTDSAWGRGTSGDFVAVRGGNAPAGELVGRCANAEARAPGERSGSIGFRCCAGPRNVAEVVLRVRHGGTLDAKERFDRELVKKLLGVLPEPARSDLERRGAVTIDRVWVWRPIGNEELYAARVCAGISHNPACGILVVRLLLDKAMALGWASSGHNLGSLHFDQRVAREVWLLGGDDLGPFKRLIAYEWGRVSVGPEERRVPKVQKKKKR
jgi:hypothetical protein